MNKEKICTNSILQTLGIILILFWIQEVRGHGEGPKIVPETLSVSSGSELKVAVNGLTGTTTADFTLTGIDGQYELGRFPITKDDFDQILLIPHRLAPGSYKLSVEGGGKSASVVINVKAQALGMAGHKMPHGEQAGRHVELRLVRPGWLKALIALLILISLWSGVWILRKS